MAVAVAGALLAISTVANADLVQDGQLAIGAQGFGNAHRLLTVQEAGQDTTESGAIGIVNGAIVAVSPGINDALVFDGNGVTNLGGDEVSPQTDTLKFGIPTLGELGWTNATDVNLLFNADEPGGDGITVNDVTLKFYSGNSVIAAIDGNFSYADTIVGNGNAGFLIDVSGAQRGYLNSHVFNQAGYTNFRIALETTMSDVADGPDSFSAVESVPVIPEPETYAMMLAGLGLMGFIVRRRKQNDAAA